MQARIKKIKFYVHLANEEMGAATVDSDSKSEEGQRNYWDKTQICSRQRDFELSNGILLRRPVRYFDFWNVLNEGLHGVQFFEYANY